MALKRDIVGWREWALLPTMAGGSLIKAKIDTGATTSAVHVENLKLWHADDGQAIAGFDLHPTSEKADRIEVESHPIVGFRFVRSSSGHGAYRPVIRTALQLGDQAFQADVTLTNRDQMGFRMLLGRAALRGRFHVDPSCSFLQGKPSSPSGDEAEEPPEEPESSACEDTGTKK